MICKNCGQEIPAGNNFCPNCGARAEGNAQAAQSYAKASIRSFADASKDDELRLAYIGGKNPEQILKKLDSNSSFNGYAILFGPLYFLWRKMYLELFLSMICLSMLEGIIGVFSTTAAVYVSLLIYLVGFLFYPMYRKKVERSVQHIARKNPAASREALIEALRIKGGTSRNTIFVYIALAWLMCAILAPALAGFTAKELASAPIGSAVLLVLKMASVLMIAAAVMIIMKFIKDKKTCDALNVTGPSFAKPVIAALILIYGLVGLFGTTSIRSADKYYVTYKGFTVRNAVISERDGHDYKPVTPSDNSNDEAVNEHTEERPVEEQRPGEDPAVSIAETPTEAAQPQTAQPQTAQPQTNHIEFQEPEETAAPEENNTGAASSAQAGEYTINVGNNVLHMPAVPRMVAEQHDGWVAYTTSPDNFDQENLYVAYMDSYLKTSDDAGLAGDLKLFDDNDLYENVNKFDFTANGRQCHAVTYNFKDVKNTTNLKIYEDVGAENYVMIDITDRKGMYTAEELANKFIINMAN